jgi:hypothetical protein
MRLLSSPKRSRRGVFSGPLALRLQAMSFSTECCGNAAPLIPKEETSTKSGIKGYLTIFGWTTPRVDPSFLDDKTLTLPILL